jgi:outer membrane protein assembly factor BamB
LNLLRFNPSKIYYTLECNIRITSLKELMDINSKCSPYYVGRIVLVLAVLSMLILPVWAQIEGKVSDIPPEVTKYARDWPLPNRDYNNSRATMDSTINSGNVKNLGLGWSFKIPGIGRYGGAASSPLIIGNTVYFQDLKGNIFALDLKTGDTIWQKIYNSSAVEGPNGPAVGWGKVFAARDAYNIVALNATTGKELWTNQSALSPVNTTGIDIQPSVYGGMVYISTVPGTSDIFYAAGGRGILYALNQDTGKVAWSFETVPKDLWGHPEVNSGGGSWYTPSVDTKTGIIFWAIANAAPFPGTKDWPSGSSRPGPNLYTDTMMALNHSTGDMVWYKQVYRHDLFDYDLQIAPILTSANISGVQGDIVLGAGKMGKVYAFNRSTGDLLWQIPVGIHNENSELSVLPPGVTRTMPAVIGGVETPMAYSDGVLYVPVIDMWTDWTPTERTAIESFDDGDGELVAIDVDTGKILWYNKLDSINIGAATVVNDLVFTATYDGYIYAFKKDTGKRLWKYRAPAGINGWPAVAGDMIIWPAGIIGTPSLIALKLNAEAGAPQAMITSPENGSLVNTSSVTVTTWVNNFNLINESGRANAQGEGRIIYYMDTAVPMPEGKPAVSATGSYEVSGSESYTWKNVTAGMHNFSVQLVNNDLTPLNRTIEDTVWVMAQNMAP